MEKKTAEIGLIGLAVMGKNLARNISNKGFHTVVYNRTTDKMTELIEEYGSENLSGEKNIKNFIKKIKRPRKIIIMVKAGEPVDMVINEIIPHLEKNDIIIDCGNSNYVDTKRRFFELKSRNIHFIGCGVSGGEEGALNGPSMMPGGSKTAWKSVEKIFTKASAKDFSNEPCVTYIGDNGAGHYVKMVHNGIEYGVMQLMAEAYEILRTIYKLPAPKIAEIFARYNKGKLNSYLFEIAVKVLNEKDEFKNGYLIDHILDKAAQKGTGQWTAMDSLERSVPLSTITQAVYARVISGAKVQRNKLSKLYKRAEIKKSIPLKTFIPILNEALYAGMLSTYAQGYELIRKTAKEEKWEINLGEVSRIWEGGCIIRAKILNFLHKSYKKSDKHLLELKEVQTAMKKSMPNLRKVNAYTSQNGIPSPALATAQSYFEAMTQDSSSANMIQGLRDFFGAHTYERTDKKGSFHTKW